MVVSGSSAALSDLTVDNAITASGLIYPSLDGTSGQVISTDGSGNLSFSSVSATDAEATHIPVKNTTVSQIDKGTPVYITGNVGNSERLEIAPADASDASKMPAVGLLETTLAANGEGYVVQGGYLRQLVTDTIDGTATTSNDTVYVKPGGGLTMTKPTGDTNYIQNIAKIARSHGSAGSVIVSSILRTNDVPNLPTGKIWVGSAANTVTSSFVHLDESNGRLGIGTASPQAELHVEGDISGSGNVTITRSDSTEAVFTLNTDRSFGRPFTITNDGQEPTINAQDILRIQADDGAAQIKLDASGQDYISFKASSGEDMRLTADGYLGIGTTSPQDTLHVEGNITGSGNLTISDHNYASNNNNRLRITPNYEKSSGVETGLYFYGNRTGSYSSNVSTYHFANDLRVDTTGSADNTSDHINLFNRLTVTERSRYDDLYGFYNIVRLNGDEHVGDQAQVLRNDFQISGTGNITHDEVYANLSTVSINNANSTVGDILGLYLGNTLTAGSASAYYGIDFQQSVNSNYHISGDYALIWSDETTIPTVGGNAYNIYLPAAMESYLGGDLNIGQAISASGAITGSDVQIDDWGSVSASLASINASGYVDGTGAANKVAFWTDADTLSNDTNLHWDSTNDRLGIGTTNPLRRLSVGADGVGLDLADTSTLGLYTANTERLRIDGNGKVGINQPSPSYTLDVNGDANIQSGELRMTNGQNIRFGGAQAFAANSGTGQVTISSHGSLTDTTINSNLGVSGSLEISGSATLEGDLTVTGTVTAQEFHTEFVSASIIYQSGSTKFGDDINDVHNFTGSINLSGSIDLTGDILLDRVNESKIAFGIAGDMYGFNSANNVYLQKPGSSGGFNFSTQGHSFQIFTGTTAENVTLQTGTTPGLSVHSTGGLRYTQHAATNNNSGYVLTYTNGTAGNGERGKVEIAGDLTIEDYSSGTAVEAANIKNNGDAYFSGSVGIGATNPNQKLHVEEDLGTGGTLVEFKNSNSTYQQQLTLAFDDNKDVTFNQGSSAGGTIFDTGTRGHSFAVNGTTNIVFTGDGDVGIGTTSPDSKLEVAGDIHLSGNNTNRLDLDADVKITGQYNGNAGSELTYLNMYNGGNASINMGTKHSNGFISFESGDGAYTERMRITNSGNVGIGTETPAEKLDVYGNIRIHTGNELRFNNANVGAYRDSNDLRLAGYSSIQFLSSPTSMGSQTERMRIDNTGNVGIGTTSPSQTLTVEGAISSSGDIYIGNDGENNTLHFNTTTGNIVKISGNTGLNLHSDNQVAFIESDGNNTKLVASVNNGTLSINRSSEYDANIKLYVNGDSRIDGTLQIESGNISYQENTDVDSAAAETVASVTIADFDAAFFDYVIKSGTNLRAGTVTAVHDGTNVEYNEVSTQDLGDTTDVTLSVDISGADMRLRATTTSDNWLIKSLVRTL